MTCFCLMLSRFCLAAWVGIAAFFVTILVALRSSKLFSEQTLLNHPKVLFPLYYSFEFWLLGIALACGIAARRHPAAQTLRSRTALVLLAAVLLLAVADYLAVYRPLAAMIESPTLPQAFGLYHSLSRWINTGTLAFSAVVAALSLWPGEMDRARSDQSEQDGTSNVRTPSAE